MFIKLAVCEDHTEDQDDISRLLNKWEARSGHLLQVSYFTYTEKLLGAVGDSYEAFDIYLLDIELRRKQEGLELARDIRKQSEYIPIIFITRHTELSYDSYDVHALHFISKPIHEIRLFSALDKLTNILEQKSTCFITCTIDGILRRYPLRDIIYLQSDDHYILINGDDNLRFRCTMDEITSKYPEHLAFLMRGYAVNVFHIRSIYFRDRKVTLTNGIVLPASKHYLSLIKMRFRNIFGVL